MSLFRKRYFFLFLPILFACPEARSQDSGFSRAYDLFTKKDYAGALARVKGSPAPSALKDYERWLAGKSKIETGDAAGAASDLELLIKDEPQSLLAPAARVELANAYLALSKGDQAIKLLSEALATMPANQKAPALYALAQAELAAGQKDAAVAHLREAFIKYPGSAVDEDIQAKLAGLQASTFTSDEKLQRANALYDAKKYSKALEAYDAALTGSESGLARVMKGEALYNLKRYGDASIYLAGAGSDIPAERARPALLHLGMSLLKTQGDAAAVGAFERVQSLYPGTPEGEEALYRIGMIALQAKRMGEAGQAFDRLAESYPRGNFRDKGLWAIAWESYRKGSFGEAKKFLQAMESGAADPPTLGKAIYWLGRVAEKQGDSTQAKAEWTKAVQSSPYSYYGVLALKRLKGQEAWDQIPPLPPEWKLSHAAPAAAGSAAADGERWDYHFKKTLALYHAGLGKESLLEGDAAVEHAKTSDAAKAKLLEAAKKSDAYYFTLLLGQKYWDNFKSLFKSNEAAESYRVDLMFPYAFRHLVEKAAQEFSLPPFLIVALMRQESGFMPWIVSSANAQGLMQLLPGTAAPRAQSLGLSGYSLFDPDANIRLGTSELANMLSRFGNNYVLAFAGYNAGPGRAKQWSQEFGSLPPDEFVEEIPFSETNLYAKLVLRNYWSYRLLYGQK